MHFSRPQSRTTQVRRYTSPEKRQQMAASWRQSEAHRPLGFLGNGEPPQKVDVLVKAPVGLSLRSGNRLPTIEEERPQAYCTCRQCIEGFISPRMKWLLIRYANIFKALLPRSLNIFEGMELQYLADAPDLTFVDLDIYKDLNHLPVSLRRTMQRNNGLMHGYCDIFGHIATCLENGYVPSSDEVSKRIHNSQGEDSMDARLFLMAGGSSRYALQYLIDMSKEITKVRNGSGLLEQGLSFLPLCLNDYSYSLLEDRLLK